MFVGISTPILYDRLMASSPSKKQVIDSALFVLDELLTGEVDEWLEYVRNNLDVAKSAQMPIQDLEPYVRNLWVECYARSIFMNGLVELRYEQICEGIPEIRDIVPRANLDSSLKKQNQRMGAILGSVIRDICQITPNHLSVLELQLEQPQLGEIQQDSRIRAVELTQERSE